MKHVSWTYSLALVSTTCLFLGACRSTMQTSEDKSLPISTDSTLSLETWLPACNAELANPASGKSSREELIALAKTDDCATAFPTIQKIVDDYLSKH